MATFSDYYRQQAASLPPSAPQRPAAPQYDFSLVPGSKNPNDNPQSPLNWLVDIITRPLNSSVAGFSGVLEGFAGAQEKAQQGDALGSVGSALGGVAALPTNSAAGFLGITEDGDNADFRKGYSHLIERFTDRFGKLNDPNYVDVEHNVDPVAKGIVGFAGDVVLDPLTWVPGALLVKGGSWVAKAGKGAVDKVAQGVKGGRAVDEAVDVATPIPKTPDTPQPVRAVEEDNVYLSPSSEVPTPTVPGAAPAARAVSDVPAPAVKAEVQKSMQQLIAESPKVPAIRQELKEILEATAKNAGKPSVKDPYPFVDVDGARFADEAAAAAFAAEKGRVWEGVEHLPRSAEDLRRDPKMSYLFEEPPAPKKMDLGEWVSTNPGRAINEDDYVDALQAGKVPDNVQVELANAIGDVPVVRVQHLDALVRSATAPESVKKAARIVLREVHKKAPVAAARVEVTSALGEFVARRQADSAKMEDLLGPALFEELGKKNTPNTFELATRKVLDALDPEKKAGLANFYEKNKSLGNALNDSLGIPRYVKGSANTVEEVAETVARVNANPAVVKAIASVLRSETPIHPRFFKKYPEMQGKTAFTEADQFLRDGRNYRELNSLFQYSLYKKLFPEIVRRVELETGFKMASKPGPGVLSGTPRTEAVEKAMLELGDEIVHALQTMGVKMHVGIGDDLVPISYPEVYRIVGESMAGGSKGRALYGGGTYVAPSVLLQAAHRAITAGDGIADDVLRADLLDIITNPVKYGVKGDRGELLPNFITRKSGANKNPEQLVGRLVDGIIAARPALAARVASNAETFAARGVHESAVLGQGEINRLKELVGQGSDAEILARVDDIAKNIAEEGTEVGALQSSVLAATEVTKGAVGDATVKMASAVGKTQRAAEKVARGPAVDKGSTQIMKVVEDDVAAQFDEVVTPGGGGAAEEVAARQAAEEAGQAPVYDLSPMDAPVVAQQGFVGAVFGGARKVFDQTYGISRVWNVMHSKRTVSGQILESAVAPLRELRKFDVGVQNAAVKAIQTGTKNSSPEVQAAVAQVEKVMSLMFDTKGTNALFDNKFLATEKSLGRVNEVLQSKLGKDTSFQFKEMDSLADTMNQWRSWDFTNPSADLYKLLDAAVTVTEHRAIAESFVSMGLKAGFVSKEFKPGYVKVGRSGDSTFASLFPEGTYIQKEAAQELHRLDVLTRTSREMGGEIGKFMRTTFLPTQSIWKQLVTVFRLGHHVRNEFGNNFMSWIDRGNRHWATSQRDALKLLGMRNNYDGIDLVQVLKSTGDDALPVGGDIIVRGRFGDKSAEEIMELAQRNGLFSTYAASEDLLMDQGLGAIARVGNTITNSRPGQMAGGVSHFVDHKGKLQHFIQILKQEAEGGRYARFGKNTSFEKVVERAVRDVKRSHPDAMMLTPTESKYRWVIPFYTWFAKTMPFAMESMLRNPGRVAAIPKASYNLAVATGVNPDSIVDPFPDDQLFPSYITEGIFGPQFVGPNGEYVNINPGVPHFDLLRDIGTDPIRGVAGMTSPLFRVPAEMMSGGSWGSGARINDNSDYLDQNLPIINYIANMTGTSVTGSIPSVLSGQGLDHQRQVARGNKGDFDRGLTFANWFAGLNAQNWSRPNIVNYAEIEKRNRASGSDRSGF